MKNVTAEVARVIARALFGAQPNQARLARSAPQHGISSRQTPWNAREGTWQRRSATAAIRQQQREAAKQRELIASLERRVKARARRHADGQS